MNKKRVLFIGLDSAEPELLMRWSKEGVLPNFARLWSESAWTTPATLPGFGNDAVWTSMYTGLNPGRHGRYYYLQFQPDSYELKFRDDDGFHHQPFWQTLSKANRRIAVIDVAHANLTPNINGIQIADWLAHGRYGEPRSWPAELVNDVMAKYGEDPLEGNFDRKLFNAGAKSIPSWRDMIIERVRKKTALSREIYKRESWNLFMTTYGEPHDVGHAFWHLHDAHHPDHITKWAALGDPIKDVYVEIDNAIGEWAKLAGNHSHLVVFSGPGMGPNYTANGALDELLIRIERHIDSGKAGPDLLYWTRQAYRKVVPQNIRLRLPIRQKLQGLADPLHKEPRRPRLSYRKFFAVPHNDNAGAIRFNVRGRESYGIVEPGAQLVALRQQVIEELRRTINKESGKPLVDKIVHTAQEYHGARVKMLPDLLVIWSREAPIRRLMSPTLGPIEVPPSPTRTGDHTPQSLFMVRAVNGSSSGPIPDAVRLMDIAPTISSMLDVVLADVDGTAFQWNKGHR
jgi:predicted AlkP superfamily phosphohydrolase/phosphomutase